MLFKGTLLVLIIMAGGFKPGDKRSWNNHSYNKTEILTPSVLLNNPLSTIPINDLAQRRIVSINAGSAFSTEFNGMIRNYADISSIDLQHLSDIKQLDSYNTLIVQLTAESLLDPKTLNFLLQAQKSKELIVAGFGNTAALAALDTLTSPVIWNVQQDAVSAEQTARIIFGGEAAQGKLSQSVSAKYLSGSGYTSQKSRIRYANQEELRISSAKLGRIDDIVIDAIRQRATPSAVVMVVKDGNVIFNKAYGSHTYDGTIPTRVDDIYDLASITKVAATTMAAMRLYDQQKLNLNAGLGTYLEDVRSTNKSDIPVRDVLLHQAGFVNLDFYSYLKPQDHSLDSSDLYSVKIADQYYLRKNYYHDVMWQKMLATPLPTRGEYVYSDISMYMMKEVIEHQTQESLDKYVSDQFYSSLGMRTAGYNPMKRFNKDQIVPTERDTYFRKTLLQGYVQDPGASLANGVAGHAGLFSSANDLAILNQMLLNGGTYGGIQYFRPETVQLFTSSQSGVSRRGLGFDRGNGTGYPSSNASPDSFGHTGYTGTCVWVDPKEKLVYIFLSNRVYPSASNKLNSLRVRPRIQDAIYEALAADKQYFSNAE